MDASSIVIFIGIALFAAGFIYMNFIFPIKAEREEREEREKREKLQEQSSVKQNTKGQKGNNKRKM